MTTSAGYAGETVRTRIEAASYACPCGERFGISLLRAVDVAQSPAKAMSFLDGKENRARCPACGAGHEVQVSVVYHDPAAERLVLVLPDSLRHRELDERALLYRKLASDGEGAPRYVREFRVCFGAGELRTMVDEPTGLFRAPAVAAGQAEAALGAPETLPATEEVLVAEPQVPEADPQATAFWSPIVPREPRTSKFARPKSRDDEGAPAIVVPVAADKTPATGTAAPIAPAGGGAAAGAPSEIAVAATQLAEVVPEAVRPSGVPASRLPTMRSTKFGGITPPPAESPQKGEARTAVPRLVEPRPSEPKVVEPQATVVTPPVVARVEQKAPSVPSVVPVLVAPAASEADPGRTVETPPLEARTIENKAVAPRTDDASRGTLFDPRAAAIDRWVRNGEDTSVFVCGDEVLLCLSRPRAQVQPLVDGPLEVRIQLHRLPTYPLLAIALVPRPVAPGVFARAPIHALLEIGRAAHRAVTDRLSGEFSVSLELFDEARRPLGSRRLPAPLEENLRRVFPSAKRALIRIPSATRSFENARLAFEASGYDRVGRVDPELPEATSGLLTPSSVRAAVAQLARWSEATSEGYLIEVRSFPLPRWRELRAEVVRRAVELGIHTPRALAEKVIAEGGISSTWPELLSRQLAAFTELSLGQRPSVSLDLGATETAENWRLLLSECREANVAVEASVRALSAARGGPAPSPRAGDGRGEKQAIDRAVRALSSTPQLRGAPHDGPAPAEPSAPGIVAGVASDGAEAASAAGSDGEGAGDGADLGALSTEELLRLLETKELRLEAALSLCERKAAPSLAAIFSSLPRMSRLESSRVLPALLGAFGVRCDPYLVEGLRSRKSFVRQGCALSLGSLHAGGVVPSAPTAQGAPQPATSLIALLLEEHSEVWREVARALGDLGPPATQPLLARLRALSGDGRTATGTEQRDARDRIALALAHLIAGGVQVPLERIATGPRDSTESATEKPVGNVVREVVRQALALRDEVRSSNAALRSGLVPPASTHAASSQSSEKSEPSDETIIRAFSRRFYDALREAPLPLATLGAEPKRPLPVRPARSAAGATGAEGPEVLELSDSDLVESSEPGRSAARPKTSPFGSPRGPSRVRSDDADEGSE